MLLGAAAFAQSNSWSSRPLAALLEALRHSGVEVFYSSELVPPGLHVDQKPAGATLLDQVSTALATVGLQLTTIAPGRYAVVRAPPAEPASTHSKSSTSSSLSRTEPAAALEEVSIYASHFALDARDTQRGLVLNHNQIEQVPGAENDALRATHSLPGFAADASARPFVRGSLQDDVLMVFDHVPIADPFHLKSFQSLTSAFDSSVIDRMELYSGGYPVRFGTRSGGVIDLTPHTITQGHEERVAVGLLAAQVSSAGRASGVPLSWMAAARRSVLNALVETGNSNFNQPVFVDVIGRLQWRTNDQWSWILGGLYLNDRVVLRSESGEEQADAQYGDTYVWLRAEYQPAPDWSSRTTLNVARAERTRTGQIARPVIIAGTVNEERDFSSVALSSEWTYGSSEHTQWNLGAEAGQTAGDNTYHRELQFDSAVLGSLGQDLNRQTSIDNAPRQNRYAAFASLQRSIGPRLQAELGLRVDGERYPPGSGDEQWSPRLNVRYRAGERLDMYASWGKFTQAQRPDEWRLEEGQVGADPVQEAWHHILGFVFKESKRARWRIEFYSKRWNRVSPYFDNLLGAQTLLPDLVPDRIRIAPLSAEADGAELSVRGAVGPSVQYWGGYTWARVTDELPGGDVVRSWNQTAALGAGMSLTHGRYSASGALRYHSGWPRTAVAAALRTAATDLLFNLGPRNADRWGPYVSLDARAAWTKPFASSELTIWAELSNLANRGNDCCVVFMVPSPTATAATSDAHWPSRALNLGLSWRFH